MSANPIMLNDEVTATLHLHPDTLRDYLRGGRKVKPGELDFLQAEHYKLGGTWMWVRSSLYHVLKIA